MCHALCVVISKQQFFISHLVSPMTEGKSLNNLLVFNGGVQSHFPIYIPHKQGHRLIKIERGKKLVPGPIFPTKRMGTDLEQWRGLNEAEVK